MSLYSFATQGQFMRLPSVDVDHKVVRLALDVCTSHTAGPGVLRRPFGGKKQNGTLLSNSDGRRLHLSHL